MNTRHAIEDKGAVGELVENDVETAVVDEVAERERNLEASVQQVSQAKIDYADDRDLDGRLFGQTLVEEELMRAREWEIERTRRRWDRNQESDRERRCRVTAAAVSESRRDEFAKRAASVDPWADPERADARAGLSRETLGAVNREAGRIAERLDGFSRAAVSRMLARRVVEGADVASAVVTTCEELRTVPGQVVPIGMVRAVGRPEVDVEGLVTELWKPSHASVQQVGLLEDNSGRIKFTVWKKSRQPTVRVGDRVRFRGAARNWYRGRVSVALTGWSRVELDP